METVGKIERPGKGSETASIGPRPTVVETNGSARYMVAHDVAKTSVPKGRYILTVYCVGKGTLWAAIRFGSEANFSEVECAEAPQPTAIQVDISESRTEIEQVVTVVPVGETVAAFSYVIERSSP